jgi:hypothetical protein
MSERAQFLIPKGYKIRAASATGYSNVEMTKDTIVLADSGWDFFIIPPEITETGQTQAEVLSE